jgi:hypothetical protein
MNYVKPFSMKEEGGHIPKEKKCYREMSKEAPFPTLVSLYPYIWLAITFYEGSTIEKHIYMGP